MSSRQKRLEFILLCVQIGRLARYLPRLGHRLKSLADNLRKPALLACGWMAWTLNAQASTGVVNFQGELTTASCRITATGQASGADMHMTVDFGTVAFADLRPPGTWVPGHGRNFILMIICPGEMPGITRAKVTFEAADGSGLDPDDPSLLALSADSLARGAGIGLWRPVEGTQMNLGARPTLSGLFTRAGDESIAKIVVAALYSRTSARALGGSANAALPIELSYE
jgi:major type 1 subunit fimbrin (pilin)